MSEDRSASAAVAAPPEHGEVLRAVIAEGNPHVSPQRAFDAPEVWKISLADVQAGLRGEDLVDKVRVRCGHEDNADINAAWNIARSDAHQPPKRTLRPVGKRRPSAEMVHVS